MEQLQSWLASLKTAPRGPDRFILTYDPTLGFYLCRNQYKTLAWDANPFCRHRSFPARKGDFVIVIETYNNSINPAAYAALRRYYRRVLDKLEDRQTVRLGYDPYHQFKSKLSGEPLPAYMIVVRYGRLTADMLLHYDETILPARRHGTHPAGP